ncbi:hypothetical protein, partial [Geomonas sp.]|uniref:hypothetical protein n=1 Tax=Geomonas sp. TaxID=2651584 RepID=UPI002B45E31B
PPLSRGGPVTGALLHLIDNHAPHLVPSPSRRARVRMGQKSVKEQTMFREEIAKIEGLAERINKLRGSL